MTWQINHQREAELKENHLVITFNQKMSARALIMVSGRRREESRGMEEDCPDSHFMLLNRSTAVHGKFTLH